MTGESDNRDIDDGPEGRSSSRTTRSQFLQKGALIAAGAAGGAALLGGGREGLFGTQAASAAGLAGTPSFPGGSQWDAAVRALCKGKTLHIGWTPTQGEDFFTAVEHGAAAQMDEFKRRFGLNFKWERFIPTGFKAVENQITTVQAWTQKGLDAIMICTAADHATTQRVFKDAMSKGTYIYEVNMFPELYPDGSENCVSAIGYNNNTQAGYLAGEYLKEKLANKGRIYLVWGAPTNWAISRLAGLKASLKGSGIQIAGFQRGNYVTDQGMTAALSLLRHDPHVNAIYAENSEMGVGVTQAMKQLGLKQWDGKSGILTITANGKMSDYQNIQTNSLTAVVNVNPVEQGRQSIIAILYRQILGYKVDPVIFVPTKVLDKTNYQEALTYYKWAYTYPLSA
jgi:ribose transport system substrate-binding protein